MSKCVRADPSVLKGLSRGYEHQVRLQCTVLKGKSSLLLTYAREMPPIDPPQCKGDLSRASSLSKHFLPLLC